MVSFDDEIVNFDCPTEHDSDPPHSLDLVILGPLSTTFPDKLLPMPVNGTTSLSSMLLSPTTMTSSSSSSSSSSFLTSEPVAFFFFFGLLTGFPSILYPTERLIFFPAVILAGADDLMPAVTSPVTSSSPPPPPSFDARSFPADAASSGS